MDAQEPTDVREVRYVSEGMNAESSQMSVLTDVASGETPSGKFSCRLPYLYLSLGHFAVRISDEKERTS